MTDPDSSDRVLLVFDLDETLIHSAETRLPWQPAFALGPYHVYCRPYLTEFLTICAKHYQIAVWSSGSEDYAGALSDRIMPEGVLPRFIWGRDRCTRRMDWEQWEEYYLKDLRKVKRSGFDLQRVLIVEDTPKKVHRNYGNAIYVLPFFGSPEDDELRRLAKYLVSIHTLDDVRRLEKRDWGQRMAW